MTYSEINLVVKLCFRAVRREMKEI